MVLLSARRGDNVMPERDSKMTPTRRCAMLLLALLVCRSAAAASGSCSEILQLALADHNPDIRKQAVIALSLAGPRYTELLTGMVDDKDFQVRLAAVGSLAATKSAAVLAALRRALDDDVPEVSFAAAKTLWAMHDPAGKRALLAVLARESVPASNTFSMQKREALRMMKTPRTAFLLAMQKGIGFVPVPFLGLGVASMQTLLTDPTTSGRAAAALMLATDKDQATRLALKDALTDKDWSVRAAAVHSLALRREPGLRNDLAPLLDDENQAVRLRVAAACARLSPNEDWAQVHSARESRGLARAK
jgi:HEAT repeat protein